MFKNQMVIVVEENDWYQETAARNRLLLLASSVKFKCQCCNVVCCPQVLHRGNLLQFEIETILKTYSLLDPLYHKHKENVKRKNLQSTKLNFWSKVSLILDYL